MNLSQAYTSSISSVIKDPGSIMAYLKEKGWATYVTAGAHTLCPGQPGIFRCYVTLTPEVCMQKSFRVEPSSV